MATRSKERESPATGIPVHTPQDTAELLRELVAHLRQNRTELREEWARRITRAQLLTAMTEEEIFAEATSVYDNYVEALETGTFEALQAYARNLSERIIPRGVETHEVVGIVLLLRDVLARSLFAKYHEDFEKLNRILDAYEPAANRIANTVAGGCGGSTDPEAGPVPDRVDSVRAHRRRPVATARSADRAGRQVPRARRDRRRDGARRDGLLRGTDAARHRPHGPAARRRDGDRWDPARGGVRDGAAGPDAQGCLHRPRPGRGTRLPRSAGTGSGRAHPRADHPWLKSCWSRSPPTWTS